MRQNKNRSGGQKWYAMDLHLHTPASSDYQEPSVSYLDILRKAEQRGLDIIGFADHNTASGYRRMEDEIEQLRMLRNLKRILPEEEERLKEYERLRAKILVLPGFEFTATFGFHVLGLFDPKRPLREIEHILLDLNVPSNQLEAGSVTVGASADVLTAYQAIHEAGGIVIAAHANSTNGVAMRGFNFGGQTKIAYTQDPHLHALEVTDLDKRGRHSTAAFFSGIKPEYPRRMHIVQGSDAHRMDNDPKRHNNLGIGGRITEVLLPAPTFEALKALFESNDFARTRPAQSKKQAEGAHFDFVRSAREQGSNIVQEFHESMSGRNNLNSIIADVCAFANTNGGTLFVGLSAEAKPIAGVRNASQAIRQLEQEIAKRISPPLACAVDSLQSEGKSVLRVIVPRGDDPPYAVDDNQIYLRTEAETGLAVRDEIVRLVTGIAPRVEEAPAKPAKEGRRGGRRGGQPAANGRGSKPQPAGAAQPAAEAPKAELPARAEHAPRTGVEVVTEEQRNGVAYYIVRDLRNNMVVNNVTEKSARKLWHYAITVYAGLPKAEADLKVEWRGDFGLLKHYVQRQQDRYDFVQRVDGGLRYYFGVTEEGVHGDWRQFVIEDPQENEEPAS
ncbi:MAG: putative DNA binding domain-containing protein [Anaerolineales bacterium]|nr:MAG: putative DNA binding domain-containing protein [Anaerolineales bacterium]